MRIYVVGVKGDIAGFKVFDVWVKLWVEEESNNPLTWLCYCSAHKSRVAFDLKTVEF